jgi:hypothetical protein
MHFQAKKIKNHTNTPKHPLQQLKCKPTLVANTILQPQ